MNPRLTAALLIALLATAVSPAQTPLGTVFTYQGQLKQNGQPYSGSANLVFKLFDASSGGNLLGTQTLNGVNASAGLFTVLLDASGEFGANAFNGDSRWLEVTVNGTLLTPRQALTAMPYAEFAAAPWRTSGSDISYTAGNVAIGANSTTAGLHVKKEPATASGTLALEGTTHTYLTLFPDGFGAGRKGFIGFGGSSQDFITIANEIAAGDIVLAPGAGGRVSVTSTGAALQATTSGGTFGTSAVFGNAQSSTGNTYGVVGQSSSTLGTGVFAHATSASGATYGVWSQSDSQDGTGCYGWHTSLSGKTPGAKGETASTANGTDYDDGATGVLGVVSSSSPGLFSAGVRGINNSTTGFGAAVVGIHRGGGYGVYGQASSPNGDGVWGYSGATTGEGKGVVGWCNSGDPLSNGVFCVGNFDVTGNKSFRIDHPLDSLNKYLLHYCSEGPEPLNVYAGNVTTDQSGKAWVQLPDYFDEINKDPKYSLTVVDDSEGPGFVQVKIARKIWNNRFEIMTSAPHIEVSWRVDAVRNDRWVQWYGAPVELDKPEVERGTYQRPELYDQPPEMGMNYHAEHERPSLPVVADEAPR